MIKDFLLAKSEIYQIFNDLVVSKKSRKNLIEGFGIKTGDKILDIGCGTASILEYLPEDVEYTGFDFNENYISFAKKRFKNRGKFFCGKVDNKSTESTPLEKESYNFVFAIGVLHHLTNEQAINLFNLAENYLIKGGKFITLDGCFTENQSPLVKLILNMDRGKFVRNEEEYLKLAKYHFQNVKTEILHNLINIPYTHVLMEGIKN